MLAAQELLRRRRRPTAVCAANDQSAIGLLDQLLRAGIDVPGDIAVAGYDDSTLARLAHIDLTTVSQEPRQQAERAVRAVVERLDENRQDRLDVLLEPRLVVRHTTAPQVRRANAWATRTSASPTRRRAGCRCRLEFLTTTGSPLPKLS